MCVESLRVQLVPLVCKSGALRSSYSFGNENLRFLKIWRLRALDGLALHSATVVLLILKPLHDPITYLGNHGIPVYTSCGSCSIKRSKCHAFRYLRLRAGGAPLVVPPAGLLKIACPTWRVRGT